MERSIKSAERTLRLLEFFSRRQKRLCVSEVAQGLAIPQPSASVLLANLARIGYLEYDRIDRSYAPTIRVALLGCWIGARAGGGGPSLASQFDELHRDVGEDCLVGIQNGAFVQIVYARGGRNDILSIDSGRMYSLTSTAMGRALLALKSDSEIVLLMRRCNAELESRFRVGESSFLALVQEVRRNRYATLTGNFIPGLMSIAVVVQSRMGSVPFGITFIGPIDRMKAKQALIVQRLLAFQTAAQDSDGVLRAQGEYTSRLSDLPRDQEFLTSHPQT
jgi:IclR family KDG regulon transcriptional repressor